MTTAPLEEKVGREATPRLVPTGPGPSDVNPAGPITKSHRTGINVADGNQTSRVTLVTEPPNTVMKCPKCSTSMTPDNWFTASTGEKYHFYYCDECDEHFENKNLNLRIVAQGLFKK